MCTTAFCFVRAYAYIWAKSYNLEFNRELLLIVTVNCTLFIYYDPEEYIFKYQLYILTLLFILVRFYLNIKNNLAFS